MAGVWFDAVHALKRLRHSPKFIVAVVLSMGLGNALTMAAFSAIDAVVLRPFPYRAPAELCVVWGSTAWDVRPSIEPDVFAEWVSGSREIQEGEFFQLNPLSHVLHGGESIGGSAVGPGLFSVLGVVPALGRAFAADRGSASDRDTVILSHAFWRSYFGSDRSAVGRSLRLDGRLRTVIGVMPEGFFFPDQHSLVWTPLDGETPPHALVRLRTGATVESAQEELNRLPALSSMRQRSAGIFALYSVVADQYRLALGTLFAAAVALLLIASANVTNLVLARGSAKGADLAVSAALGASPSRMARLVAFECLWLGLGASAVGLAGGYAALQGLRWLRLTDVLRLDVSSIDGPVIVFGLSVSLASALLASFVPALRASRADVRSLLQAGGIGTQGTTGGQARGLLVTLETTLALTLLIVSGLLAGSFIRLVRTDWGFDPENLLAIEVVAPQGRKGAVWEDRGRAIVERLSSMPGLRDVAISRGIPIKYAYRNTSIAHEERRTESVQVWTVGSGYFRTMRIPIVQGREFSEGDDAGAARVTVVSRDLAAQLWPGQDPIGREFSFLKFRQDVLAKLLASGRPGIDPAIRNSPDSWEADGTPLRVIGVAGTVRAFGLDLEPRPALYLDFRQDADDLPLAYFMARTTGNPAALARPLRDLVSSLSGADSVRDVSLMSELVEKSIGGRGTRRLLALVSTLIGSLGLLFATLGVYGVVSFAVAQSARETAVRRALGATPRRILAEMLKRHMRPVFLGTGLGLACAFVTTRQISSMLFGAGSMDPLTVASMSIVLLLTACAACAVPVIRSLAEDPIEALRQL